MKARAISIELILVEVYAVEDIVENIKIVYQVGPCTRWYKPVPVYRVDATCASRVPRINPTCSILAHLPPFVVRSHATAFQKSATLYKWGENPFVRCDGLAAFHPTQLDMCMLCLAGRWNLNDPRHVLALPLALRIFDNHFRHQCIVTRTPTGQYILRASTASLPQ